MKLRIGGKWFGAFTLASCSPAVTPGDAGPTDSGSMTVTDAGIDAGYDAGVPDAGPRDAGVLPCPCFRADGGCAVPEDFPRGIPDYNAAQCDCMPNSVLFCYDETAARCTISWACNPGKEPDGGVSKQQDGSTLCLC